MFSNWKYRSLKKTIQYRRQIQQVEDQVLKEFEKKIIIITISYYLLQFQQLSVLFELLRWDFLNNENMFLVIQNYQKGETEAKYSITKCLQ